MLSRVCLDELGNVQTIGGVSEALCRSLSSLHARTQPNPSSAAATTAARVDQRAVSASSAPAWARSYSQDRSSSILNNQQPQQQQCSSGHTVAAVASDQRPVGDRLKQQPASLASSFQHVRSSVLKHQLRHTPWATTVRQQRQLSTSGCAADSTEDAAPGWKVWATAAQHRASKQQWQMDDAHPALLQQRQQQQHTPGKVAPEPSWTVLEQARQQEQEKVVQVRAGLTKLHAPREQHYPVIALHLGAEIDVNEFLEAYKGDFEDAILNPPHRDNVIFQLKNSSDDQDMLGADRKQPAPNCYMIVYRYGSVIFIDVPEAERQANLALLRPYIKPAQGQETAGAASVLEDPNSMRTDKTMIVVRADMREWSDLEPDQIVLQKLELAGMRVISHVLAQSVALDYFNSRVDRAIQQFTPYLNAVAATGQCGVVKEAGLLQLIADNSLLYTDVVTKIGLLDISPTAWKNDKHFKLWEDLRTDYEIERRFDAINRKLGPMLENAKFLLDVRAEQKSSSAEWIIIGLICLEVVISGGAHLASYMGLLTH